MLSLIVMAEYLLRGKGRSHPLLFLVILLSLVIPDSVQLYYRTKEETMDQMTDESTDSPLFCVLAQGVVA